MEFCLSFVGLRGMSYRANLSGLVAVLAANGSCGTRGAFEWPSLSGPPGDCEPLKPAGGQFSRNAA